MEDVTWDQVLTIANDDYNVAFGGQGTSSGGASSSNSGRSDQEIPGTNEVLRGGFPFKEYLERALGESCRLSPVDVVTTEDWNANGGISLGCTSARVNERLLELHLGVTMKGHQWFILTAIARLSKSMETEEGRSVGEDCRLEPWLDLLGGGLSASSNRDHNHRRQQQPQPPIEHYGASQCNSAVAPGSGPSSYQPATPATTTTWESYPSSEPSSLPSSLASHRLPENTSIYSGSGTYGDGSLRGVIPGAKHWAKKDARSRAANNEAKTLRLCKEKMFESFETGIPQLHRESVATKKVFRSCGTSAKPTGSRTPSAPATPATPVAEAKPDFHHKDKDKEAFTWIDVVGKWEHHDLHTPSLDDERSFQGGGGISGNVLASRTNIHSAAPGAAGRGGGERSSAGGSPTRASAAGTFHPRTSMSGSVRKILLGLESEYDISLPLSQILTEISTPSCDSGNQLTEMVSKALRTNYLNSDDLEAAAAAANGGGSPDVSLGKFGGSTTNQLWADLGDGGFSPPPQQKNAAVPDDDNSDSGEADSGEGTKRHHRPKAEEHLLVMSTSSPFLRKALKTTLPPAGSSQEARSQKASLALAEFLKTGPGGELIKNLTERWLIYLNLHKRLVITIRPSDSIPIARIRENWSSRFQHLSMLNFVWQIYSSAVINFRHALDETLSLMDEVESLMTPSFVEKQLLQGITAASSDSSGDRHLHGGKNCHPEHHHSLAYLDEGGAGDLMGATNRSSFSPRHGSTRQSGADGGSPGLSSPSVLLGKKKKKNAGPPPGMSVDEWQVRQKYSVPTTWEKIQLFFTLVWTGNKQGSVGQQQLHTSTVSLLHLIYRQVSVYHRTLQTVGNQEAILADIFRTTASTRRQHQRRKHTIATFSEVIRRMVEESSSSSSSDDDEELAEEERILGKSRVAMGEARALRLESVERLDHTKHQVEELMNLSMSMNSDYLNDLVYVLTIIQTVFTPIGFAVTQLGVNFLQAYVVLFNYTNGYFVTWGLMLFTVVLLLCWFFFHLKG